MTAAILKKAQYVFAIQDKIQEKQVSLLCLKETHCFLSCYHTESWLHLRQAGYFRLAVKLDVTG